MITSLHNTHSKTSIVALSSGCIQKKWRQENKFHFVSRENFTNLVVEVRRDTGTLIENFRKRWDLNFAAKAHQISQLNTMKEGVNLSS